MHRVCGKRLGKRDSLEERARKTKGSRRFDGQRVVVQQYYWHLGKGRLEDGTGKETHLSASFPAERRKQRSQLELITASEAAERQWLEGAAGSVKSTRLRESSKKDIPTAQVQTRILQSKVAGDRGLGGQGSCHQGVWWLESIRVATSVWSVEIMRQGTVLRFFWVWGLASVVFQASAQPSRRGSWLLSDLCTAAPRAPPGPKLCSRVQQTSGAQGLRTFETFHPSVVCSRTLSLLMVRQGGKVVG